MAGGVVPGWQIGAGDGSVGDPEISALYRQDLGSVDIDLDGRLPALSGGTRMGRVGSEMFRASADCRDANRSGAAMPDASSVGNTMLASLW
jgi:hypothetical protein